MVRACLTETNSMLIDISPSAIEGVYAEKRGEDQLVSRVMFVAKEY